MRYFRFLPVIFLCVFLAGNTAFATPQIPDLLIYKGDTLRLYATPLEYLYENSYQKPDLWGEEEACISTACWRGYQAEWTIEGDYLYLTNIYTCCPPIDKRKADLKRIFGNRYVNGKVKADWFSGNAISPQGELLYYLHDAYHSVYEEEIEFVFKNGRLVETTVYDNSGTRRSVYSENQSKLKEYLYSNIRWDSLTLPPDRPVRVIVQFYTREDGTIEAKVVRGADTAFNEEAIRVVESIPEWDLIIKRGIVQKNWWTVTIMFSENNRKKYGNAQ